MDDPHHALHVIREQRRERISFATEIKQSLVHTSFYSTDQSRLSRTIRQALHEDEQYQTLTGEPLPEHHRQPLRTELSYWMAYDDLLHAPTVAEENYEQFCADLRPRAEQLTRVLRLEEEMLGSPLAAYYIMLVDRTTGGSAADSPTRNPLRALEQVCDGRRERVHLAHVTYRHVLRETFFDAGTTDLTYAERHAREDQSLYEDATGERFPEHAIQANQFERDLWQHLLRVHERGTSRPGPACRRLRPLARILERVLELQDDLLTTSLSAYYERGVKTLAAAAHRADKTFRGDVA